MKPVGLVFGFGGFFFFFNLSCPFIYVKTGIIINCMGVWPSILKLKGVFPGDLAADSEILGTIKPG